MKHLSAFWILILVVACPARSETWLYLEAVEFKDSHDPAEIETVDGRSFTVDFKDTGLTENEVLEWKAGREIKIAYSSERGVVMVDPAVGRGVEIISGFGQWHPIDRLVARDASGRADTVGMVSAADRAAELWRAEIARLFKALRENPTASPDTKARLLAAEKSWDAFARAQAEVINGLNGERDGTIWSMVAANQRARLMRDFAFQLSALRGL